jgi:branched-chain amino acid aminotransferase
MPVIEKNFEAYDIYTADEAFMTGTPFCMLPVTSLNGVAIGDGLVGKGFNRLIQQWSNNVGVDIVAQIKRWDIERGGSLNNDAPTPYRFKRK